MDQLTQTRLPGVGTKFTFGLAHGGRLTVIQHNDGMREVYFFRRGDEEPTAVISLEDDEARQLGAVIGGAYERPKVVEELEMALGELQYRTHLPWPLVLVHVGLAAAVWALLIGFVAVLWRPPAAFAEART